MRMVVKLASASNCSDGPNSRPQLFMKPFVSRFIGASRMPCHEIRKGLDLTRRLHDAYTSHDRSDLCQSARHGKNQVSLCDGKDRLRPRLRSVQRKKMPSAEDMEFVAKWTGDDDATMGRALGRTVKLYRQKAGLTRLQLAKRAGLRLRLILCQRWCAGHRFRD